MGNLIVKVRMGSLCNVGGNCLTPKDTISSGTSRDTGDFKREANISKRG